MPKDFLEQTLEDIIYDNRDIIHEKGFLPLLKTVCRQFQLPSGKKIDILSYDYSEKELSVYVIELKKDKAAQDALFQAYGYLNEFLCCIDMSNLFAIYAKVVLVGYKTKELPICNFLSLPVELYTYKYGIHGIEFYQERVVKNDFVPFGDHEGGASLEIVPIDDLINNAVNHETT